MRFTVSVMFSGFDSLRQSQHGHVGMVNSRLTANHTYSFSYSVGFLSDTFFAYMSCESFSTTVHVCMRA